MYLQAASVNLTVGSLVWIEDPDVAWIDGEVVEVNGENVKVLCTSGKTVSIEMPFPSIDLKYAVSSCIRGFLFVFIPSPKKKNGREKKFGRTGQSTEVMCNKVLTAISFACEL